MVKLVSTSRTRIYLAVKRVEGIAATEGKKLGISAISVAALVRLLYQCGVFSKDEYLSRLKTLHDKKFLSKSEYRRLLQGIMP